MLEFRKSSQYTDPHNLIRKVLPWVHAAGNPYFDWVFGGTRIANQLLCHWMGRPSSEISILKAQLLICKNQISGGFIALSGKELKKCRKADAMALLKFFDKDNRHSLVQRLATTSNLFPPVEDDEFYLSKMGINANFQGKGLGLNLISEYLKEGDSQGFRRYRLDVFDGNYPAIHCYRKYGFQIDKQSQSKDGSIVYYAMKYERGLS